LQVPDITKLHISSDVRFRYSVTTIESHVNNYNPRPEEVLFRVTLPDSAFISRFSMVIGNVTYPGHVREKAAATKEYEKAKAKGQSAGIIKQKPRDSNVFAVTVNVAAKDHVDFTLLYEELLTRKFGKYEQTINVDPGQIVSDLRIRVSIDESRPLTSVRAPPLKSGNEVVVVNEDAKNPLAKIETISESQAVVTFAPDKYQQKEMGKSGMSGQFSVCYDVDHAIEGGEIQVVDGYFVHFFAPNNLPHLFKHVYFVLDVSGSMYGNKMLQMKEAMKLILDDLKEGDLFTIMKFSDTSKVWKNKGEQIHGVSPLKIDAAKRFINELTSAGGTNIYDSLTQALMDMKKEEMKNSIETDPNSFYRANVVVFLTDGQPTQGSIQDTDEIVSALSKQNDEKTVALYSLGFGNDVDFEFLQRLSLSNGGFARKIYESSDATLQLVDFYKEISSPLLANVDFLYLDSQIQRDSLTKTNFNIFFEGTEIVIAGRVSDALHEPYQITSTINGSESGGSLSWFCGTDIDRPSPLPEDKPESNYLERLWAYLTIQQRLEQKKALPGVAAHNSAVTATQNEAIDAEILEMALKYEFVTPLTAMVVTKPEIELANRTSNGTASLNVVGDGEIEGDTPEKSMLFSPQALSPVAGVGMSADYDYDYAYAPAYAFAPTMTGHGAPAMTGHGGYNAKSSWTDDYDDYDGYDTNDLGGAGNNAAISQHLPLFSPFHILTIAFLSIIYWGQ